MYNFVLQTIVMLSLGTIIYLFARVLPRVSETVFSEPRKNYLEDFLRKISLEKADTFSSYWLERFLRKLKIVILRFDNLLTKYLQSLKQPPAGEKNSLFDNSAALAGQVSSEKKDTGNFDKQTL